jgi:hypothetical protein
MIFSAARQASSHGQLSVVQYFVENEPDITVCCGTTQGIAGGTSTSMFVGDVDGKTILYSAAEAGQLHIVKYLAQQYPFLINCCTTDGSTALHCAAYRGHVNVVS